MMAFILLYSLQKGAAAMDAAYVKRIRRLIAECQELRARSERLLADDDRLLGGTRTAIDASRELLKKVQTAPDIWPGRWLKG